MRWVVAQDILQVLKGGRNVGVVGVWDAVRMGGRRARWKLYAIRASHRTGHRRWAMEPIQSVGSVRGEVHQPV